MSALIVAIPIIVILAGIAIFAATRRTDTNDATGSLSRETEQRDTSARKAESAAQKTKVAGVPLVAEPATGKEVESAALVARANAGSDLVLAGADAPVVPYTPPDPETFGATRRQFLNRGIITFFGVGLSGFGAACIGFLWPGGVSGFGAKLKVGTIANILAEIQSNNGFLYKAEGRLWLTAYPHGALEKARAVYSPAELAGMEAGVVALYQKCPHLGCRVPNCDTSQWFECPCHGSQYNRVGEKRGGPAPRGMDRFATAVEGGVLTVDTGTIIQGPPIGTNTTKQEAEGPNCISGASH